ncbi:hypothetical protein [Glaciecola sp. SC05]|uniref:hypothetical protein n=1 Tax=Glaciecola sp. SC05 TaxID=1987355 RepID=UPI003528097E
MSDGYAEHPPKRKSIKNYVIGAFWILLLVAIVFAIVRSQQASKAREEQVSEVMWDTQLLACNSVYNAEPTDDFATCIKMAEDGWIDAASRVAWAYSRDGEYQSWQSAYEWLEWLSDHDEHAKLLSYVVLFEIGESEELKLSGERGIREMAVANQPAASIYLASLYYLGLNTLEQRSNIAWLINRAYQQSKYWIMPDVISKIYANGYLGSVDISKAKQLLIEATQESFPFHANNIAWLFATTDNLDLADFPLSLELAQKVVSEEPHANNYVYVDTLAAAYAANGQFDEASETQATALDLILKEYENSDTPSPEIENFKSRLSLFESGKRYIEPELYASGEEFFDSVKNRVEQTLIENLFVELIAPEVPTVE